uniref:Uncharacterized protein n=1 Tax=Leersia perrieri TaxID=77586 RepID=A0A0D9WI18_9ORYZ
MADDGSSKEYYQIDSRPPSIANHARPERTSVPDGPAIDYFKEVEEESEEPNTDFTGKPDDVAQPPTGSAVRGLTLPPTVNQSEIVSVDIAVAPHVEPKVAPVIATKSAPQIIQATTPSVNNLAPAPKTTETALPVIDTTSPSSSPVFMTAIVMPREDKGKKAMEQAATVEPADGSDSLIDEKQKITENLGRVVNLNKELQTNSDEKIKAANDKYDKLLWEHEVLKKSIAKEINTLKLKHEKEISGMKTNLEEAQSANAEFCATGEPILDALHPASAGSNDSNSKRVIELLQSVPLKLKNLTLDNASVACGQALAMIKSLYPKIDLQPIDSGYAAGTTTEKALELVNEVDNLAKAIAKDSLYPEEDEQE